MARKKTSRAVSAKPTRSDPKQNKSLAIRTIVKQMPTAKATDIAAMVKKTYGHEVSQNMVYMVKTKTNMAADGRQKKQNGANKSSPMTSASLWIDAIKTARQLLKATGSVDNATALLKALDG
jgi:hypothetical protein